MKLLICCLLQSELIIHYLFCWLVILIVTLYRATRCIASAVASVLWLFCSSVRLSHSWSVSKWLNETENKSAKPWSPTWKIDKRIYDVTWSIFQGGGHGVATLLPLCVYLVTLVWSWTWPFVNIILVTPPGSRSPIILTFYISHSDTELSSWRCQTLYTLPSNPRPLKLTGLWALAVRCTNLGRTCHTRYEKSQQLRNYESD